MQERIIKLPYKPLGSVPSAGAVIVGDFVFVAGVDGVNPETGKLVGNVESQTQMAVENIRSILEKAGTSLDNVIKSTIYITKREDVDIVFDTMMKMIPKMEDKVNCDLWIEGLPGGSLVKIEVVAVK